MLQGVLLMGPVLSLVVNVVIGVRLFRMWWRTREVPELAIGASGILNTLSFPVLIAAKNMAADSPETAGLVWTVGISLVVAGSLCLYTFNWRVFYPNRPWVGGIVVAAALAGWGGLLGQGLAGDLVAHKPVGFFGWLSYAGRTLAVTWTSYESLRYYALMRKRLRLGLADPLVANRFFLWGLAGAAVTVSNVNIFCRYAFLDGNLMAPEVVVLSFLTNVVSGTSVWLAFFPLRSYRRRFESRAEDGGDG
ncbi:MAG: hypothetical protein MJE66_24410 [Proteobacteria bacterium]|nr:hypothetical protein [Pseudomonadota bacterium]